MEPVTLANEPAAQARHDTADRDVENSPNGHSEQVDCAGCPWYWPMPHAVQPVLPVVLVADPGSHDRHVVRPDTGE